MSGAVRRLGFLLAALPLAAAVVYVGLHMPAFGAHPLPYGDAVNRIAPPERHVSNMVSAVNFDLRGFDTLGEEFMLVCAVTGTVLLLRGHRGEALSAEPGELPHRPAQPPSDAVVLIARLVGPALMVFGLYMVLHATVTPGGGFQGGVIVASGTLLLWLAEGYRGWRSAMSGKWLDAVEGGGALAFALCGLAPLAVGGRFMANTLPYGTFRDMLSGGLMQLENAGVALAVAGGFCLLFLEFLEETRAPKEGDE
jgi:multicomponent Na+:H+ antiporter subunit B